MKEFEEFETDALLTAMQTLNSNVSGEIAEKKVNKDTLKSSDKLGRMIEELMFRDVR